MTSSSSTSGKRFRFACDRCHGLKLRCPRANDFDEKDPSNPCSRCKKAGASCTASERGKSGRPTKASKSSAASSPPSNTADQKPVRGQDEPVPAKMGHPYVNSEQKQLMNIWQANMETGQLLFDMDDTSFSPGSPIMTPPFQLSNADLSYLPFLRLDGNEHTQSSTPNWSGTNDKPYIVDNSAQGTSCTSDDDDYPPRSDDITYLQRLSRLNLKVLDSLQRHRSVSSGYQSHDIDVNDVMTAAIEISGELIDLIRQLLPRVSDSLEHPGLWSSISETEDFPLDVDRQKMNGRDDLFSEPLFPAFGGGMSWTCMKPSPEASRFPESAAMFSLLGCYAQILHYFEEVLYNLFSQHSDASQLGVHNETKWATVKPLLSASMFANIIEHLLTKIQKEFSICITDYGTREALHADKEEDSRYFSAMSSVEKSFLDRAIVETRKREQHLTNKAQELQRILCSS